MREPDADFVSAPSLLCIDHHNSSRRAPRDQPEISRRSETAEQEPHGEALRSRGARPGRTWSAEAQVTPVDLTRLQALHIAAFVRGSATSQLLWPAGEM